MKFILASLTVVIVLFNYSHLLARDARLRDAATIGEAFEYIITDYITEISFSNNRTIMESICERMFRLDPQANVTIRTRFNEELYFRGMEDYGEKLIKDEELKKMAENLLKRGTIDGIHQQEDKFIFSYTRDTNPYSIYEEYAYTKYASPEVIERHEREDVKLAPYWYYTDVAMSSCEEE